MIALVLFAALVALSSAQFQPQPSGRILESPIPALCAQSEYLLPFSSLLIPVARIFGHEDRPKRGRIASNGSVQCVQSRQYSRYLPSYRQLQ